MIHLKFDYEGKKYTAEPAAFVRLPDGTQLKVLSTDGDGNATVEKNGKKNPESVSTASEVNSSQEVSEAPPLTLTDLKTTWETRDGGISEMRKAQDATEGAIAAALLGIPRKRTDPTPTIMLGGRRFKAQKGRDGNPNKLVPVADVSDAA